MALSTKSRLLMIDVAHAIEQSGYAYRPKRTRKPSRLIDCLEISKDTRITSRSLYTRQAFISDVSKKYKVTYENARLLICKARKLKLEKSS